MKSIGGSICLKWVEKKVFNKRDYGHHYIDWYSNFSQNNTQILLILNQLMEKGNDNIENLGCMLKGGVGILGGLLIVDHASKHVEEALSIGAGVVVFMVMGMLYFGWKFKDS